MSLKTIGAVIVAVVIAVLMRSDYGFYRPDVGIAATGREEEQAKPHQREVVRLTIKPEDQQRFGNELTLKRLSEFYGVEDSLPCSIRYSYGNTDPRLATRHLAVDQIVSLCLN